MRANARRSKKSLQAENAGTRMKQLWYRRRARYGKARTPCCCLAVKTTLTYGCYRIAGDNF